MINIENIKLALNNNAEYQQQFIKSLVQFEINSGHPQTNVRDIVSGPLADMLFSGQKFQKELANGLKMNFVYNSKIAREFLLSSPAIPNHIWEPQTTKLLLYFSSNAKNIIIAGAYFGDQAIPVAYNVKEIGTCHTFEPNKNNSDLIIENAHLNNLNNIIVNNLALWNESNKKLIFEGEDALASTIVADETHENVIETISIDDYIVANNINEINLIMIDVEGSEIKVLEGAKNCLQQFMPIVVFETHSLYDDWSKGLENSKSAKLLKNFGYNIYAVREFHQNIDTTNMPIELLPLDKTFCQTPPHHGFNMLAIPNNSLINSPLFKIVKGLSPKLILTKNEANFSPSKF